MRNQLAGPQFRQGIDFSKETQWALDFLTNFQDSGMIEDPMFGQRKYRLALVSFSHQQRVCDGKQQVVEISLDDLKGYFTKEEQQEFLQRIETNTKRYIKIFSDAADKVEVHRVAPLDAQEKMEEAVNAFRDQALGKEQGGADNEILRLLKRKL